MFKARRFEAKKALIRLLFKRFEKRLGISTPDVEIRIFETPRSNWGFRGLRATITYPKKLLGTTYSDYDSQIRTQMTTLFHGPGYGCDGKTSQRETAQKAYGRIVIAHSELNSHQATTGALQPAWRASDQVIG